MSVEAATRPTRDQHLAQAQATALGHLSSGDLTSAYSTMASELLRNTDTAATWNVHVSSLGMRYVMDGNDRGVRRWIEGFT